MLSDTNKKELEEKKKKKTKMCLHKHLHLMLGILSKLMELGSSSSQSKQQADNDLLIYE